MTPRLFLAPLAAALVAACAQAPVQPLELAGATLAVPAGWTRTGAQAGASHTREGVAFEAESLASQRTLADDEALFRYLDGVENTRIRGEGWRLALRRTEAGPRRDAECLRRRSAYDDPARSRRIASVSVSCRHPADAARVLTLRVSVSEAGASDPAWADAQFARLLPLLQPWVDGLVFVAARP